MQACVSIVQGEAGLLMYIAVAKLVVLVIVPSARTVCLEIFVRGKDVG